jgi:hypothetical protein
MKVEIGTVGMVTCRTANYSLTSRIPAPDILGMQHRRAPLHDEISDARRR